MELRRRTRRRIIRLLPPSELPDLAVAARDGEVDAALRVTYHVLGRLPADERIAFALRFIEGMELMAIADMCQVSVATTKRRLLSGRRKFINMAKAYPELVDWVKDEAP
jgi:RNA polymerase sigma-70 factor (ECF subfamily)